MSISKISSQSNEEFVELKELYPIPLPELDLETKPDDTTFTSPEKVALRASWRLFELQRSKISRDFFINFYTENEMLIERFRSKQTNKLNTKSLIHHSKWVEQVIKDFITIGFHSNDHIDAVLQDFLSCHRAHCIPQEDMNLYTEEFKTHFLNWFSKTSTPTLRNAFNKMNNIILNAHEVMQRRSSVVPVDIQDY